MAVGIPECQCVRERERERESEVMRVEREGVQMLEFETVLHPATKRSPWSKQPITRSMAASVQISRFRPLSGDTALSNLDRKPETEEATNRQTKTKPTVYSNTR